MDPIDDDNTSELSFMATRSDVDVDVEEAEAEDSSDDSSVETVPQPQRKPRAPPKLNPAALNPPKGKAKALEPSANIKGKGSLSAAINVDDKPISRPYVPLWEESPG